MQEIVSLIIWSVVYFFLFRKSNYKETCNNNRLVFFHMLLGWFLLLMHCTGIKMLAWTIANLDKVDDYFYISIGPIANWFVFIVWFLGLIFHPVAMIISLQQARRKDSARVWLLRIMPVLYGLAVGNTLIGYYKRGSSMEHGIVFPLILSAVFFIIPFALLFVFYTRESVREEIFSSKAY